MIEARLPEIRDRYPNAYVCGGSTAGEIVGKEVRDDTVLVTAIELEKTELRTAEVTIASADDSLAAGRQLASAIPHVGLVHAFVLSDGIGVNGSDLVRGLCAALPPRAWPPPAAASADGERFGHTYVCAGDTVAERRSVLLGFYGDAPAGRLQLDGRVGPLRSRAARHPRLRNVLYRARRSRARWSSTSGTWASTPRACRPAACCFR